MALLDDVAIYLAAQGHGSLGTTSSWRLYKSALPASTGRAIVLTEVAVPNTMGHQDASLDTKRFQVRVRGPNINTANAYSTADTKLNAIRTSLEAIGNETLGAGTRYYTHIVATMSPVSLGTDDNSQPHLALTFSALRSKTT